MSDRPPKWSKEDVEAALEACREKSLAEQKNSAIATPMISLEKLGSYMGVTRERARQLLSMYGLPTDLKGQCVEAHAQMLRRYAHLYPLPELFKMNKAHHKNIGSLRVFLSNRSIEFKNQRLHTGYATHKLKSLDFDTAQLRPAEIMEKAGIEISNPLRVVNVAGIPYKKAANSFKSSKDATNKF